MSNGGQTSEQNNNERTVERMISKESMLTDYDSDEHDWSDYDGYYDNIDEGDDEGNSTLHSLLEADMERLKNIYGPDTLSYRLFSLVDSIDVELTVDKKILQRDIAMAWKINPDEPIVIRLHLSVSHYLDGEVPKVEVFQPSQKEKFGIGSQLRKILENFLSAQWKVLSNDDVQSHLQGTRFSSPPKKRHQKGLPQVAADSGSPTKIDDPQALSQIMDMGFSAELATNALVMSRWNVVEAINLLLQNPDCCTPAPAPLPEQGTKQPSKQQGKAAKNLHRQRSRDQGKASASDTGATCDPGGTGGMDQGAGLLGSINSCISKFKGKSSDDLSVAKSGLAAKEMPGLEQGFLVMILRYVYQRLPTLNDFCVVCDELHVFQNGGMLKPAVCARELCTFAFMSLGVMSDAADDIATGADVVDLLIAMANAACLSTKRDDIFEPYPIVVDPDKPKEFALTPKKKDFNRVKSAINSFMRMTEMIHHEGMDLKNELDRRDKVAYPLLQWIITSNRSHIVKLPPEKQMTFMRTPHQFLLLSSPPAKEAIFREAKTKFGSTFAFHGSPLENWHSIMRQGLINASGTKYQRHGAAYGKGIYLSPHGGLSFGYSGMAQVPTVLTQPTAQMHTHRGRGPLVAHGKLPTPRTSDARKLGKKGQRFLQSTSLTCIALCEVILSKDLKKNSNIWVMPDTDHVCTRFFFVYEDGQTGEPSVDTTKPEYSDIIHAALGYHAS